MFFVAGVTGNTGSVVASSLLAQGKRVRALARDAAKAEPWRARGVEVAVGSLKDEAALARALAGVEGAYLLLPPRMESHAVLADYAALSATYARAVAAAKVPHVVLLSSRGAHLATGTGNIRVTHNAEQHLAQAAQRLTVLRAAFFMENWGASLQGLARGVLPTFFTADRATPYVATRDVGLTAAQLLAEGPSTPRAVVELSGPREYSPRDVAEALSRVVGRPVVVEQGPTAAMVPALVQAGFTEDLARLFQEMTEAANSGYLAWEGGGARALRGSTPIETVLESLVGGAAAGAR
jgi:uncharacterized protein YbjT (DUF2867 family)